MKLQGEIRFKKTSSENELNSKVFVTVGLAEVATGRHFLGFLTLVYIVANSVYRRHMDQRSVHRRRMKRRGVSRVKPRRNDEGIHVHAMIVLHHPSLVSILRSLLLALHTHHLDHDIILISIALLLLLSLLSLLLLSSSRDHFLFMLVIHAFQLLVLHHALQRELQRHLARRAASGDEMQDQHADEHRRAGHQTAVEGQSVVHRVERGEDVGREDIRGLPADEDRRRADALQVRGAFGLRVRPRWADVPT